MSSIQPGNLAFAVPPAEDDQVRRQRDAERAAQEQAAARTLEATSIGEGGLRVIGGSINIEAGGQLNVDGDAVFNGSLTVPSGSLNTAGNVTAGGNLTAGATVQGASVVSTGGASIAGTLTSGAVSTGAVSASDVGLSGALRALSVYNTTLTTSYRAVWCTSVDGQLGYVPSSERVKQDVKALAADPEILLQLQVVAYRYIAAVEHLGDAAAVEVGFIAERVHELGVWWLVDYDDRMTEAGRQTPTPYAPETESVPFGIRYERVGLAALLVAQHVAAQQEQIKESLAEIRAHLGL